jgi:hypothetical protein
MKRHPDGTWRSTRRPMFASEAVRRARWIEAETIHLKRMGFSFEAIAEHLNRVSHGREQPMVALPDKVTFPPDYSISRQACHKAFRRALAREPALEVEELRRLDAARSEEMFSNLQPKIRKGDVRAIEAGIRVLDHAARVGGYTSPHRHEVTGKDGKPLTVVQLLEAIGPIPDEENL